MGNRSTILMPKTPMSGSLLSSTGPCPEAPHKGPRWHGQFYPAAGPWRTPRRPASASGDSAHYCKKNPTPDYTHITMTIEYVQPHHEH